VILIEKKVMREMGPWIIYRWP